MKTNATNYTIIPNSILLSGKLNHNEKAVIYYFIYRTNNTVVSTVYIGQNELMKNVGISNRLSFTKTVNHLEELGFITVKRVHNYKDKKSNEYTVNYTVINNFKDESQAQEPVTPQPKKEEQPQQPVTVAPIKEVNKEQPVTIQEQPKKEEKEQPTEPVKSQTKEVNKEQATVTPKKEEQPQQKTNTTVIDGDFAALESSMLERRNKRNQQQEPQEPQQEVIEPQEIQQPEEPQEQDANISMMTNNNESDMKKTVYGDLAEWESMGQEQQALQLLHVQCDETEEYEQPQQPVTVPVDNNNEQLKLNSIIQKFRNEYRAARNFKDCDGNTAFECQAVRESMSYLANDFSILQNLDESEYTKIKAAFNDLFKKKAENMKSNDIKEYLEYVLSIAKKNSAMAETIYSEKAEYFLRKYYDMTGDVDYLNSYGNSFKYITESPQYKNKYSYQNKESW